MEENITISQQLERTLERRLILWTRTDHDFFSSSFSPRKFCLLLTRPRLCKAQLYSMPSLAITSSRLYPRLLSFPLSLLVSHISRSNAPGWRWRKETKADYVIRNSGYRKKSEMRLFRQVLFSACAKLSSSSETLAEGNKTRYFSFQPRKV